MSLSEILVSNTGNQNWKSLYVYSLNSQTVVNQPQSYIEMFNSNAQGLGGTDTGQTQQFNIIDNQLNFNSPTISGTTFTPSSPGFYLVTYSINFQNNSGITLFDIRYRSLISYNAAVFFYGTEAVTTTLQNGGNVTLSTSAVIKFNGTTDNIQIVAAQNSGTPLLTGNNSISSQQNKMSIHFLHPI